MRRSFWRVRAQQFQFRVITVESYHRIASRRIFSNRGRTRAGGRTPRAVFSSEHQVRIPVKQLTKLSRFMSFSLSLSRGRSSGIFLEFYDESRLVRRYESRYTISLLITRPGLGYRQIVTRVTAKLELSRREDRQKISKTPL